MDDTLTRLKAVIQQMKDVAPAVFATPPTEQQIVDAEAELEVTFPATYRRFLQEAGAADFPYDIYGLWTGDELNFQWGGWDVVYMTKSERNDSEPPLPASFIAICTDGMGSHWCLDTGQMSNGECPVVFWNPELAETEAPEVFAPTFLDWLIEYVSTTEIEQ